MVALLCSLLSGLAFGLSLPPYNLEFLAWIALAPLLWASCGRRPSVVAGLGLLSGVTSAVVLARWHSDTTRLIWAYVPFLWVVLLFAIVAMTATLLRPRLSPERWVLAVVCTAMTLEWATSWLPMPVNVALTQYRNLPLIQLAGITGIWGVSLLVWLANATVADALLQGRRNTKSLKIAIPLIAVIMTLGAAGLVHGISGPLLNVAAIQDYPAGEQNSHGEKAASRADLTNQAVAAKRPARFVVWSEECLLHSFHPGNDADPTRSLARQNQIVLVSGYIDDTKPKPHNCAAVINVNGEMAGVFQKKHLYLAETLTNIPGETRPAVDTGLGRVGAEVCFDSFYTGITRGLATSGAQIIALPNYDPPTPYGTLHYLHSAMLPFRAVENGVPFVRSDPSGLSQIIDSQGRVLTQGGLYRAEIVSASVHLGTGRGTLFTKLGDWLAWLCILGCMALHVRAFTRSKTPNLTRQMGGDIAGNTNRV